MSEPDESEIFSIRDTNGYIRALVEQETLNAPRWVSGLVRGAYLSDRGHLYFNLHEGEYSIRCMVRNNVRGTIPFTISNQMEVEVYGRIRLYEPFARIEIDVEKAYLIERPPFVIDASVKERLEKEGLWPRKKLPLTEKINKIAVITSEQSYALRDYEFLYREEQGGAPHIVFDVLLQGQQAPLQIADKIAYVNQSREYDVIALIRGGGPAREIDVFNDYLIAEAIGLFIDSCRDGHWASTEFHPRR